MVKELEKEIEDIILVIAKPNDEIELEVSADAYFEGLNSLRFIELITAVENKYNIRISTKDMLSMNTGELDDFINMVERYVQSDEN